jgi:hypothetical protein
MKTNEVALLAEFVKRLQSELEHFRGRALTGATYWVAQVDVDDGFDASSPNKWGPLAIELGFGSETIFFAYRTVGLDIEPTEARLAYRIEAYNELGQIIANEPPPSFVASQTDIWRPCMLQALEAYDLYGALGVPLALSLSFAGNAVVIALGYSSYAGDPAEVADGDELLILTEDEFFRLASTSFRNYERITS